ncbi:MAG: GNAT family N-acetyltransferase [Myxococcales bacterium]|nr:GNAT family N-acetyltransferase [Myxococcales bacterium]
MTDAEWRWIAESEPARWDEEKARIVGREAEGVFDPRYAQRVVDDVASGSWWRVEEAGKTLGYGWMDVVWGDAEILLAVARDARGRGVGSFIMQHLEKEAFHRGLRYVTNVVRATHPERERIVGWLETRGFTCGEDGRHFRSVATR